MVRTRVAYCREFCVSSRLASVGDTLTNLHTGRMEHYGSEVITHVDVHAGASGRTTHMSVLALPPRESDMSMVSLWLR